MRTLRSFDSLKQHLAAAARGLGFDDKLERPHGAAGPLRLKVVDTTDGDALRVIALEVSAPLGDGLSLGLRRRTFGRLLGAAFGFLRPVPSWDADLDAVALLETREAVRVRAAVKAGLGAVARELLAAHPEAWLEADGGRLVIGLEAREGCLEKAIDLATRAAAAVEAARIRPVEKEADVRCGFCHGELRPDEASVVRCARCKAPVHEGCWRDNDGCPVMGCLQGAPR